MAYLVLRLVELVVMLADADGRGPRPLGRQVLARHRARGPAHVVADGVGVVRRSRALLALVAVELSWGFGMVAWETLAPPLLEQVTGTADRAAALLGPVGATALGRQCHSPRPPSRC